MKNCTLCDVKKLLLDSIKEDSRFKLKVTFKKVTLVTFLNSKSNTYVFQLLRRFSRKKIGG